MLLADADVLIDYVKTDRDVLAYLSTILPLGPSYMAISTDTGTITFTGV